MSTTEELARTIGAAETAPATAATAATAVAAVPAAQRKPHTLVDFIRMPSFQKQMKLALPKSLTAERLTRIVMTECKRTPALLQCDPESFYGAVMQCAALGLEPGSALGHCYLLPFGRRSDQSGKKECQLIIGYRGMIDLARRSGQIKSISAFVVHEADDFHYELGLHPDIHHVPSDSAQPGPITFVYAVAMLKDGGVQFEVMSRAAVESVRATSKAGRSGPWSDHWVEMAKKTVIRRLFKYLPVSVEVARAVEVDEKTDRGEAARQDDVFEGEFIDKGTEVPAAEADDADDIEEN